MREIKEESSWSGKKHDWSGDKQFPNTTLMETDSSVKREVDWEGEGTGKFILS